MLGVGPEVGVHDVQVDLHPGRVDGLGQRQVARQAAVAGRRVHPDTHPHPVGAVVPHDLDRVARAAAIGELSTGRELLRGEGQVPAKRHLARRRIRPEQAELADAHRRARPALDVDLRITGRRAPRERKVHGVARVEGEVRGRPQGRPLARARGELDGGVGRGGGGVECDADAVQRTLLAEVDGQRAFPRVGAPLGARVTVDRVRCRVAGLRRVRARLAGQRPVDARRRLWWPAVPGAGRVLAGSPAGRGHRRSRTDRGASCSRCTAASESWACPVSRER